MSTKDDDDESRLEEVFAKVAAKTSQATGSVWTFGLALCVVLAWAATGPFFGFSETWQLVINTGTTIVTFLMVFIIQHAQNKDMRAIQLKLNELIAAVEGASNRLIDVEDLTDRELEHLYARYQRLATSAQRVSHGAKLTIDTDDSDHGSPDPSHNPAPSATARAHQHAESEADKRPVSVKPEAANRGKSGDT